MIKPPSAVIAILLFAGVTAGFLAALPAAYAQTATPASGDAKAELADLTQKVRAKISAGKKTEADFTDELKQFDTILNEHKGEKTDNVAQVLLMKAQLYSEIFADNTKALELVKQLKNDFPNTKAGMNADRISAMMIRNEESKKIQRALANGSAFPDFDEKDIDGKPASVANYKGKVVLVDFWATWCGPCVGEMPNVISAYQKYHDKGFEIIGVSLDQDKDSLTNFIKAKNMPWQQYFDGLGWQNKLAVKYRVNSIPTNYLIGTDGKIIDKGLRGSALDDAVAKALGQ